MALFPDDIKQIAALQVELLSDSLVSRFGRRYAEDYWRYVGQAKEEAAIIIHAQDGTVAAACSLSLNPQTLSRRLLVHTPLLLHVVRNVLKPWLWLTVRSMVVGDNGSAPTAPDYDLVGAAEVVMLMTHPLQRRQGHARALLVKAESILKDRGIQDYYVRTTDENSGTVAFYLENGFQKQGHFCAHGVTFRLMTKTIL